MNPIQCDNCQAKIGRLEDARVWLHRPVCDGCYRRLKAAQPPDPRTRLWMALAASAAALAVALGVALAFVQARSEPPSTALPRPVPAASSERPATREALVSRPAAALAMRLVGTRWQAPNGARLVFNADGTVSSTPAGEVATWTALDGRFVVRKTPSGWIDVLVFNDEVTSYTLHAKDFVNAQNASFQGRRAGE